MPPHPIHLMPPHLIHLPLLQVTTAYLEKCFLLIHVTAL